MNENVKRNCLFKRIFLLKIHVFILIDYECNPMQIPYIKNKLKILQNIEVRFS